MKYLCVVPVRNEGPFLLEWIAHYLGAGVTDFLFFSNDCEDGTDEILNILAGQGLITHIPIKSVEGQSIQWQALKTAWKHPLRKTADWMMVVDADEMINIHAKGHTFDDLIAAIPDGTDAISMPWRLFGNNGCVFYEDALATKSFTTSMPASDNHPFSDVFFKTLFRPNGPFNQLGIHRPKQKKDQVPNWVDGSGAKMHEHVSANPKQLTLFGQELHTGNAGRDLVELNHYSVRSAENFMVKRARGLPNRSKKNIDLAYWTDRNFNTEPNDSISKMAANTAQHLATLREIPGISEAHERSVMWHKQKFQTLMRDKVEFQLFKQILIAGDSAILPRTVVRKLGQMYHSIDR